MKKIVIVVLAIVLSGVLICLFSSILVAQEEHHGRGDRRGGSGFRGKESLSNNSGTFLGTAVAVIKAGIITGIIVLAPRTSPYQCQEEMRKVPIYNQQGKRVGITTEQITVCRE